MNTKRRADCQLRHDWKERIIRIGDEQTSLQNQFDNFRNEYSDTHPRIEALETDVNALDGRLIIAESDISDAEDRISACESDIDSLESEVNSLDGRVSIAESDISDAEARITACEANIDRIDAELVDKTGEINALANRMTLAEADIVISCTAACHYVLRLDQVQKAMAVRSERPLMIIDIAVPRDVDPLVSKLKGVHLFDIDDLKNVVDENFKERQLEAIKAERIVREELAEFNNWLNTLFVVPTIVALKEKAEKIKQTELTRAFNRLGSINAREEKVITSLANSIVNQLLHDPIIQLKAYASDQQGHLYTEVLQNLFRLELNEDQAEYKKKVL